MPFLRLTRDRRGIEHTFLMHAETPGQKARVLYWYRTAPEVSMGRPPLDEEAIRLIEEQHPGIEFDWPAILALSEVMMPEEEPREERPVRRSKPLRGRDSARPPSSRGAAETADAPDQAGEAGEITAADEPAEAAELAAAPAPTTLRLLEELVGREIATRLRARHAELLARIHSHVADDPRVPGWLARAESLNPDTWLTPEIVLAGVQRADLLYDTLRRELHESSQPGPS